MRELGITLTGEQVRAIHAAALRVLEELGVRVEHAGLRARLAGRGCRVAGQRVYYPTTVVEAALRDVPRSFSMYGRTPAEPLLIGGDRTCCTNTGIFASIYDFETGAIRRTTLADVADTTRLLDALDCVDAVYVSLVDATELPAAVVTVADFACTLEHTTKPLIGPGVTSRREAEAIVALARVVRGGDDAALRRYPLCVPFVCPVTPLHIPAELGEAIVAVAEAGLPLDALSNPVMGVSAPFTLAGTVALGHAEVLAVAVAAQAVAPGLPILSQNTPSIADMRSMASTTGGPETGLLRQAATQVAQYAGLPGCAHGHTSSARVDFQAAEEKALNGLLIAAARPAVLGGMGALANVTLTSYETLVLDNERYGALKRILDGVQTDAEHLGFEVIAALAEGGTAMDSPHTLRFLRSREVWQPRLALRQGLVNGLPPAETSLERARSEARRLLETHHAAPLASEVRRELDAIVQAYAAAAPGARSR